MGKKTKKFLIICGIVVGAGLLLTIIGAAANKTEDGCRLTGNPQNKGKKTENPQIRSDLGFSVFA